MIPRSGLSSIGAFAKPHGIKGEISARIDAGLVDAVAGFGYVFVEADGLMVPFPIVAVRPKGPETLLLTVKGIDSQEKASALAGKEIWIEKSMLPDDDDSDGEGFYADDLIGFTIEDNGRRIGTIEGFDDSTENVLFIVAATDGAEILIPASDSLIEGIDPEARIVFMNLPEGLLTL